jgi:hypothetical protein
MHVFAFVLTKKLLELPWQSIRSVGSETPDSFLSTAEWERKDKVDQHRAAINLKAYVNTT